MATLGTLEYLISIKDNGIEAQLNNTEKKVKKSGDKLNSWMIAKGQMISRVAEKAIAATGKVARKSVEFIKSAVDSFSEFQQLEGGVNKLFGKNAQTVINNASKAFMTAGVSMNEYMQTVTEFSAALISGLGDDTAEAARIADQALIDMSDNANMFGSSMESIQNAYRGFSKQNYTMLDNLKLGYGGTRKEMERLLQDAEAYQKTQGKTVKYDIKNLGDVYEAIHAIQQKLKITGTTEHEALSTVEGSFKAAQAAWKDVLTSIGRGKDVKKSIKQFADTAKVYIKNLKPVIKESIKGAFTTIKELLPEFSDIFKNLTKELKESDVPLLQVLGRVFEKVSQISQGITNLATDFDGTVAAMKASDDPFVKLAGGALATAKDIIEWIGNNAAWVADHIGLIASAFAGIKISKDILKFLSLLQSSKITNTISKLFNNNNTNTNTNTKTTTTKTGLWSVIRGGLANTAKTLPFAIPAALLVDTVLDSINMWKEGSEKAQAAFDKATEFKKNIVDKAQNEGLGEAWETLASYFSTMYGDESTIAEKNNKLIDLAKRYDNYMNKDIDDPMIDALTDLIVDNDELWSDLYDTMALINKKGDRGYTDEERDMVEDTMQRVKKAVEEGLEKEAAKVPVDPDVDIQSAQSQLNSANLKLPVTPTLNVSGLFGGWFGHAKGAWSVPYDNYPALLHRNERVLTASQARNSGNDSMDYATVGAMIGDAVNRAFKKVNVLMSGEKVGDLTTKRVRRNVNASTYSKQRAYGG